MDDKEDIPAHPQPPWIKVPSKSHPGHAYWFNTKTKEKDWCKSSKPLPAGASFEEATLNSTTRANTPAQNRLRRLQQELKLEHEKEKEKEEKLNKRNLSQVRKTPKQEQATKKAEIKTNVKENNKQVQKPNIQDEQVQSGRVTRAKRNEQQMKTVDNIKSAATTSKEKSAIKPANKQKTTSTTSTADSTAATTSKAALSEASAAATKKKRLSKNSRKVKINESSLKNRIKSYAKNFDVKSLLKKNQKSSTEAQNDVERDAQKDVEKDTQKETKTNSSPKVQTPTKRRRTSSTTVSQKSPEPTERQQSIPTASTTSSNGIKTNENSAEHLKEQKSPQVATSITTSTPIASKDVTGWPQDSFKTPKIERTKEPCTSQQQNFTITTSASQNIFDLWQTSNSVNSFSSYFILPTDPFLNISAKTITSSTSFGQQNVDQSSGMPKDAIKNNGLFGNQSPFMLNDEARSGLFGNQQSGLLKNEPKRGLFDNRPSFMLKDDNKNAKLSNQPSFIEKTDNNSGLFSNQSSFMRENGPKRGLLGNVPSFMPKDDNKNALLSYQTPFMPRNDSRSGLFSNQSSFMPENELKKSLFGNHPSFIPKDGNKNELLINQTSFMPKNGSKNGLFSKQSSLIPENEPKRGLFSNQSSLMPENEPKSGLFSNQSSFIAENKPKNSLFFNQPSFMPNDASKNASFSNQLSFMPKKDNNNGLFSNQQPSMPKDGNKNRLIEKLKDICKTTVNFVQGKEFKTVSETAVSPQSRKRTLSDASFSANDRLKRLRQTLAENQAKAANLPCNTTSLFNITNDNSGIFGNSSSSIANDIPEPMDWEPTEEPCELKTLTTPVAPLKASEISFDNVGTVGEYYDTVKNNLSRIHAESQKSTNKINKDCFYIVVDTNVLLDHLTFVKDMLKLQAAAQDEVIIFLPYAVLRELDKLKINYKRESVKTMTVRAIKYLNSAIEAKNPKLQMQSAYEERKHLINIVSPDDSIINCCLQLQKAGVNYLLLVSEDVNLRNMAESNGISARSVTDLEVPTR